MSSSSKSQPPSTKKGRLKIFLGDPQALVQHAFKGKKRTAHAKGVQPPATTKKRRSGAVEISYMAKYRDRLRTLSTRSKGLWKKAFELAVLTGVALRLVIRGEYFDSVEAGFAKETHVEAETSTPKDVAEEAEGENIIDGEMTDPALSPRAFRPMPSTSSGDSGHFSNGVETREFGVQCTSVTAVPIAGTEMQCRLCGALFEDDSKSRQEIWVGCDKTDCPYWIHADCLLGKSPKITPKFVKQLPFLCPAHK